MKRLLAAFFSAILIHAIIVLLPLTNHTVLTPQLSGNEAIQINLASIPINPPESVIPDTPSPILPIATPLEQKDIQKENTIEERVQQEEEQKTQTTPVIPPTQTKKKRLERNTTNKQVAENSSKPTHSASTPQSLQDTETNTTEIPEIAIIKAKPITAQNPRPQYPELARRRGWHGHVLLLVNVFQDGSVDQVIIHTSSGYKLLDESALHTVKNWHFLPGSEDGKPIAMEVLVPVHFKLGP